MLGNQVQLRGSAEDRWFQWQWQWKIRDGPKSQKTGEFGWATKVVPKGRCGNGGHGVRPAKSLGRAFSQ